MAWSQLKTEQLPKRWDLAVAFKDPAKDDKLGWIDAIPGEAYRRGAGNLVTFKFLSATDTPLPIKAVRTPFECTTLADIIGKGRGKLTMRMQINRSIWESLDDLDAYFRKFLVKHRGKLFSAQDADYISRDNSAIALKCKALAPRNFDGTPVYDAFITLRINGRSGEISDVVVKESEKGKYVSKVNWAPRTTPLAAVATRFSIVVGYTSGPDPKPVVKDTIPVPDAPVGGQRVRYVGPGDIADEREGGSVARFASIRPAYWTLTPGGNASITLVLDNLVIDAGVGELFRPLEVAPYAPPEGFALEDVEPEPEERNYGTFTQTQSQTPSQIKQPEAKRIRTRFNEGPMEGPMDPTSAAHRSGPPGLNIMASAASPMPSSAQMAGGGMPIMPSRSMTGGSAFGRTKSIHRSDDDELLEARRELWMDQMRAPDPLYAGTGAAGGAATGGANASSGAGAGGGMPSSFSASSSSSSSSSSSGLCTLEERIQAEERRRLHEIEEEKKHLARIYQENKHMKTTSQIFPEDDEEDHED